MSVAPLFAALFLAGGTVQPPLVCTVTPRVIEVGAFYDGAAVRVEGAAAPRSKVIVTVTGSDREERFNRKARFGPIWLNAGKVRISGAPSLFLSFIPEPIDRLLGRDGLAGRSLDERSVKARIHIEPVPQDPHADAALRADYLALKKSDDIYSFAGGGVVMGRCRDGSVPFTLEFRWPKKAPPAEYEVHAYEILDGAVVRETSVPISVAPTGFPAWLASLAENRASLYGVTAILIGALAGFGIDFLTTHIFRKKRAVVH